MEKKEQTSLPCEVFYKNYWKYHFDSVLLRFHLFYRYCNQLSLNKLKIYICNFILFFTTIIIAKCSFLLAPTKKMCSKIVSNFIPNKERFFSICSQHVSFKFPMGSQWIPQGCSQIIPHFNPICFAQSPPLLTNIGGPNGEALHLSIKYFILGGLESLSFFALGQSNWLIAKKQKLDM